MIERLRSYPLAVRLGDREVALRFMVPGDTEALADWTGRLPAHDLLFMPHDVARPDVRERWARRLEAGRLVTVIAEAAGALAGYAIIDRGDPGWSSHVAELRVIVAPAWRGAGLGRLLTQEAFAIALGLGIEKMTAQMTVDQRGALAVFQGMGFRPEALLRDHVKDREGKTHDLLILSHDVARFGAQADAYGISDALAGDA